MKENIKFVAFLSLICVLSACANKGGSQNSSKPSDSTGTSISNSGSQTSKRVLGGNNAGLDDENRKDLQGYYIQTEFTEKEWDEARALFKTHPNFEVSCVAVNTLILRNNSYVARDAAPYKYESGLRYELTKEFRDTQIGLYFWATFYGTYTYNGNEATLKSPERFSYSFDGGAGRQGASVVSASGAYLTGNETTNPTQDWVDGEVINAFNGGIINYRHNSGHDDMVVTVDQEYFTFTINQLDEEGNPIKVDEVPHRVVSEDYNYNGNNAGWEDETRTVKQGFYTMTDFSDQDWTGARALFQMHANTEISCVAHNELVLRNNSFAARNAAPYKYEPGLRYELTKQFRDTQIGLYFWATFYGTYTVQGDNVILNSPERFSYSFDGGAGRQGASVVSASGFYLTGEETTNPAQDWIDGEVINAFNGNIINYRHNSGHDPMTIKLDQNNYKFSIESAED